MYRSLWWLALALFTASALAEQFSYKQFTLPTNLVTLGSATINGTTLQLTPASTFQAGLAYYPTKVSANLGFSTNFTWVPDTCDSTYGGGDGFSFFLTKDAPTSGQVAQSTSNDLGIANVPNTLMVGYSAYLGKLFVCEWTTPLADPFVYSPQCSYVDIGRILCGGSMTVRIFFDGTTLSVYNSNILLATYAKTLDVEYFYVGLSGSTGNDYFRQSITQWAFYSTTVTFKAYTPITQNNIAFFRQAQPIGDKIQLTNGGSEAGAAVLSDLKFGFGLKTRFIWTPSNCDSVYNGADGFTFFASKTAPTNETVMESAGGGLGIQYVPNTVMAGYSATFNVFYMCNWTTPLLNFYQCNSVPNPNRKYTCGSNYTIEITYSLNNKLSLSLNGQVQISSTNLIIDNYGYYAGLSGGTGGGYFTQDISDWSIKVTDVDTNLMVPTNYVGVGSVVSTSPVLILTNNTLQSSAAYVKDTQYYISYKFESSFTWTGTNCSRTPPANGFTHYFSRFAPTLAQVQSTPPQKLGIGNTPDVYMVGYDTRARTLYICDWGTAPSNFASVSCTNSVPSLPNYVCGTPINFTVTYDSFTLKLFMNGVLSLSRSVTIYPRFYYGGFSGATDNDRYMVQRITNWRFVGYYPQPAGDFSYGFGVAETQPILRGSAKVNGNTLTLTNGFSSVENAGLMLHPQPVKMNYGFFANFNWNASSCDSAYNGGDGFAFVFSQTIPTNGSVLTSSGTGLGIQQVPNVTMIGYSSYYNEFYICSWTSPLTSFRTNPACQTLSNSVINPVHPQRYTCNEPLVFNLNYDGYSFRLSQVSTTSEYVIFTQPLPLDFSLTYYVGLSASIGDGYYKQDSTYVYFVPLV